MMRHEFVGSIPDRLDEGVLYISLEYATALHNCACGCGHEIVTPLSPTDWSMVFDGETVSLAPSIGNWSYPCRSHYWIERGRIEWAGDMSDEDIARGRSWDRARKADRYASPKEVEAKSVIRPPRSAWQKFLNWLGG